MISRVHHVAVMCWFPTKGDPIPMSIKYQDVNGEIYSIKDICIKSTNKVSQGRSFVCEAAINDRIVGFELMFFADSGKWLLSL